MMKEFYGVYFEMKRKALDLAEVTRCLGTPWGHYNDITDAYINPSSAKRAIWSDWCDWKYEILKDHEVENCKMWISSRNTMQFAITGYVTYKDGTGYCFYITRAHNRLYKLA